MRNDGTWIRISKADSIPLREGRAVMLGSTPVAIFNLGDRFLAIENECPHKGGPLCDGIVTGTSVVCPLHGWKVDLASGSVERPNVPECVRTFPVTVEDGIVMLQFLAGADVEKAA
jgi:nitrite reductase (NADH) small subunit